MRRRERSGWGGCPSGHRSRAAALPGRLVPLLPGRGFHVILPGRVPEIADHDPIVAPSARLGRAVRAAFRRGTGMPYSTSLGRRGLDVRTDLGGLNLVRVPAVLVETGNMRNPTDPALMSDPDWRRRAGRAIAAGVADHLERR